MSLENPRVSIGLAVYNGEKYLEQAIESILNQTYTDFELIISDNASTDRTQEICQHYASLDKRIRLNRNKTNIGGANNENLTFRLSKGEYFRLAAYDDILHPDLIRSCVEVLDSNPDVVLCYSQIVEIDEIGRELRILDLKLGFSDKPYERFGDLCSRKHKCEPTYGLMRSVVIRKTALQKNYTDSDRTWLSELSILGKFYEIDRPLFYKRYHWDNLYLDWRTRMAWFNPTNAGKPVFPYWLQFFDFLRVIFQAQLPFLEKIICFLLYGRNFITTYFPRMVKDLLVAVTMVLHSKKWRLRRYVDTNNWS